MNRPLLQTAIHHDHGPGDTPCPGCWDLVQVDWVTLKAVCNECGEERGPLNIAPDIEMLPPTARFRRMSS